uniref:Uncharacterized protein n=1 Tax=Rhizophora mucronata TaxID=61149 RepID=A0A2P2LP57_RHIMU
MQYATSARGLVAETAAKIARMCFSFAGCST